jgi:hypothetical protein
MSKLTELGVFLHELQMELGCNEVMLRLDGRPSQVFILRAVWYEPQNIGYQKPIDPDQLIAFNEGTESAFIDIFKEEAHTSYKRLAGIYDPKRPKHKDEKRGRPRKVTNNA